MNIDILNWRMEISVERIFWNDTHLQDNYDAAAHRWHAAIQRMGTVGAYEQLWADLLADGTLANVPQEATILDGGIGTGALCNALMPALPDADWHGIDLSPKMLEEATFNSVYPLTVQKASISELPYPDAHFDMVMSAHVVEHLAQPLAGIREMLRVLKVGQPFVLVATRRCLWTQMLSLRWNFSPLHERQVCEWLRMSGAEAIAVRKLNPDSSRTPQGHISLVYTGVKST